MRYSGRQLRRLGPVIRFCRLSHLVAPQPVVHHADSQATARPHRPVAQQGLQTQNPGMRARAVDELLLSTLSGTWRVEKAAVSLKNWSLPALTYQWLRDQRRFIPRPASRVCRTLQ